MSSLCSSSNKYFDSSEYHACLRALKQIDFELAYLVLLTYEGIKFLSRWEKPLDEEGLRLLKEMDLFTGQIRRTVKTGDDVIETIFSRTRAYIDFYEESFGDTPVDKSAQAQRLEGFLFGYPPCCVEQYIQTPYTPNSLTRRDQEILFHWACKDCAITPILLQAYKNIHNRLKHL